jgi:hypothetical protein
MIPVSGTDFELITCVVDNAENDCHSAEVPYNDTFRCNL